MSNFDLKDYEPVEDRLRAFWKDWPDGRIITKLLDHTDGTFIVKATVWKERRQYPDATGLAQEAVTERGVNATSALENCETSAIGRALANLGYAAKGKRPSREEMSKTSASLGEVDADTAGPGGPARPETESPPGPAPSSDEGKGKALSDTPEPGENPSPRKNPPGRVYPFKPDDCDHKSQAGHWLRTIVVDGVASCPRCGLSALIYRESA